MPDEELKKCGNLFGDPQKLTEYFEEKDK